MVKEKGRWHMELVSGPLQSEKPKQERVMVILEGFRVTISIQGWWLWVGEEWQNAGTSGYAASDHYSAILFCVSFLTQGQL